MADLTKVVADLKSYFSDAIGADAIFESPDTGRPYVKVAQKGDAKLYVSVDLGAICHHPEPPHGGKQEHVKAVGLQVRFAQVGGNPEAFSPPFKVREEIAGGFRLSKFAFAVCPLYGVNIVQSWEAQNITEKLVDWINGICKFAEVQSKVPGAVLAKALEFRLELLKGEVANGNFFDINEPIEKAKKEKSEHSEEELAN